MSLVGSVRRQTTNRLALARRYLSSTSTASTATADYERATKAPISKVIPPTSVFPWRHETRPLERLIPGTKEFGKNHLLIGGGLLTTAPKLDEYVAAFVFLGVKWRMLPFFGSWKADLADNVSWAFCRGVESLVSHVYEGPIEIQPDEDKVDVAFSTDQGDGRDISQTSQSYLQTIADPALVQLFVDARRHGKNKFEVCLQFEVVKAEVVHLLCFPFVSRENLRNNPQLKDDLFALLYGAHSSPFEAMPIVARMSDENLLRQGYVESTVSCQVLLECKEVFFVKDLESGMVIQGHGDGLARNVFHLVRMENVVQISPVAGGRITRKPGNWKITDIDDLLGGNSILDIEQ